MNDGLKNDRLIRALKRQPVDRTPVWMMRQAGRYLPEYRATRAQAGDFMSLCANPELACEVTLQPLRRFPLDAAILFSDILTVPDAMGLGLFFEPGEGPRFERPVRSRREIDALPVVDPEEELGYVMDAVRTIRRALDGSVPLIGFSGSPWTVATYMVEGGSSRTFSNIKRLVYEDPAAMHLLMEKVSAVTTDYLNAQIAAGAQAIMIFDTWGSALSPAAYRTFSLDYMQRILSGLVVGEGDDRIPTILFTKGAGNRLGDMADTGCDGLGVDWTTDLSEARRLTGGRVALQGNLDPGILYASPDTIRAEVAKVLESYGRGEGHVFNLGHGIAPDVDPEHAGAMIRAVHDLSPAYHGPQGD
jgi:uroporphyrinogen decarboxylase